ncbi:MAG: hypothetical protein EVA70_01435 [Parvularculaceae bacterium]|nr:MAG: hypothetical protein EVA70_01435 [Parvularculaceae bacterium]
MAQLILTAASSAASAIGKAGIGSIIARTVATTAAAFAANAASNLILGPRRRSVEGPRIDSFSVQTSTEGAGILKVYGRARVAGQVIWMSRFKETIVESTQTSGGKGGRPAVRTEVTEYEYSVSFAVGLCEGVIDRIGRVWADGRAIDLSKYNARLYHGTEEQTPDDLISSIEGMAPAYRGLAYIVFEDLPIAAFGNRIPQLSFEIEKAIGPVAPEALENALTAVSVIPSSGEFVYGTTPVTREIGEGAISHENAHNSEGVADFTASMDALQATAPNLASTSLIVAWFGDDLRAGSCSLRPGVDIAEKVTAPYEWRAGDIDRGQAHLISARDGVANYGGTPADRAVIESIRNMAARGLGVMFHPFILMDVPPGNNLPDPYGGAAQAAFPWRGRITVGANDKTPLAAADISAFFGTARVSDFSIVNGEVKYSGPAEWGFRRFILHNAYLCAAAGGVEAFLIGSEMVALTTARDGNGAYLAVGELKALASDVRTILGGATKISYGADWSEYFGHHPADGSGDVRFHLDPLWSDSNIDFVGIDNYLPLADWRDGEDHLDAEQALSQYDIDYLKENIQAGERYDWFYANSADRMAQTRTAITDGAYAEPWVFRPKDFWSWWANAHHDRPGGQRSQTPTGWVPQSKPIWFTEIGAPAIDKAANQPNVFFDPKSAESGTPYFSSNGRDDLAQRRFLEAHLSFWMDSANNPVSSVYGAPMVDPRRAYVYAWDARPFPFFPARSDVWGDVDNWARGHWLNGRLGRAPLDLLITELSRIAGVTAIDAKGAEGVVTGYVIDRPMTGRDMIEPLLNVFQLDMAETGAGLVFRSRTGGIDGLVALDDLVVDGEDAPFSINAAQAEDLPSSFRLGFLDEGGDYAPGVVEAKEPGRAEFQTAGLQASMIIGNGEAEERARALLADAHVMRETVRFALGPSELALVPGDVLSGRFGGASRRWRITEITDGVNRTVEAVRTTPSVYKAVAADMAFKRPADVPIYGVPVWELMDLPLTGDTQNPHAPVLAAAASPWPGGVALLREGQVAGRAPLRCVMGALVAPAPSAPSGRFSHQSLHVRLQYGALASVSAQELFAGANTLYLRAATGTYEVVQFRDAALQSDGTWLLSGLLRGQAGTEAEALAGASAGARIVIATAALTRADLPIDLLGLTLDWSAGPATAATTEASYQTRTLTLTGRGVTPLSPVHLRSHADGAGGWRFTWVRRTRLGGDSWVGEDVPLGEAFERYRVEIGQDDTVLRTADTDAPEFAYDADMVNADFGGAPNAEFFFRVAQISDLVGMGISSKVRVSL